MGRVRVAFRGIDCDKSQFKQSKCQLTISVGQAYHEEERLIATLALVNENFASCVINLGDTLQRHTMALFADRAPDDYHQSALLAGDQWLARNQQYYQQLDNIEQVVRWDYWLQHPQYQQQRQAIIALMETDADYRAAFTSTIDAFLLRYRARINLDNQPTVIRFRQLCMDYLVEECAALVLWPLLGSRFEIYPSRHNAAILATHQRFIEAQLADELKIVSIRFRGYPQPKPQQFTFEA